jgi:hypothetical protein
MRVKGPKLQNFTFTNNLIQINEKEITSAGGGEENCAFRPDRQSPAGVFKTCVDSAIFTNNVIINGTSGWPPGNFFPHDAKAIGFAEGADGASKFRLCRTKDPSCKAPSKYAAGGNDGRDIGADIERIDAATKGVI